MARKRRPSKKEGGVAAVLVLVAVFFVLNDKWILGFFAGLAAAGWWLGFEVKTTCDVETTRGTPCDNRAYGFLRACRSQSRHRQIKTAILLSYFGFKAPLSRIVWGRNSVSGRTSRPLTAAAMSAPAEMTLTHGTRETITFVATVVGTGVTGIALVFQVMSFAGLGA